MKFLIKGFYGRSNLGDDLILARFFEWATISNHSLIFAAENTNASLIELLSCYTNDPSSFIKDDLFSAIKTLPNVDAVILGAGGLFPNGNVRTLLTKLLLLCCAKLLGKRVVMVGIGVNITHSMWAKISWRIFYKLCDFISTRDKRSKKNIIYVMGLNDPEKKIHECADVVFSLNFTPILQKQEELSPKKEHPTCLYALANPWSEQERQQSPDRYNKLLDDITKSIQSVIAQGYKPVLAPFYLPDDYKLATEIADRFESNSINVISETSAINRTSLFNECDIVITMRFHGLVLATCFAKPVSVIAYDHKLEVLTEALDIKDLSVRFGIRESEFFLTVQDIDIDALLKNQSFIYSNIEILKKQLLEKAIALKSSSNLNFGLLDKAFSSSVQK
ncbi:polysaccharide pyruvyl transferase family protein [Ampullimonas aquatilis]|uniref:polysaccharide pyruvyl transferase family protein n=1 Tax=Ampullimonas aquatilis TaxID=1341549 RepID=UPI003C71F351